MPALGPQPDYAMWQLAVDPVTNSPVSNLVGWERSAARIVLIPQPNARKLAQGDSAGHLRLPAGLRGRAARASAITRRTASVRLPNEIILLYLSN